MIEIIVLTTFKLFQFQKSTNQNAKRETVFNKFKFQTTL